MLELIKKYASVPAPSGDETALCKAIIDEIKPFATQFYVDNLGNLIVFKKGKKTPSKKLMLDAHMDEVGFMITGYTDDGYLKFVSVGGIDTKVLLGKRVKLNGGIFGVIGSTPVHLLDASAKLKVPSKDALFIDIGAESKADAQKLIKIGDTAVFDTEYFEMGENIAVRGLDDKVGCACLTKMIQSDLEYDMYFSFSVQEEIGCRGAKVSAFSISPDCAITVESTTASDLHAVSSEDAVCVLGKGAVLPVMDNGTLYNKSTVHTLMDKANENGISAQYKTAVAGGTNASAIHLTKTGVKTVNIALPCRYIHSGLCVASKADVYALEKLVHLAADEFCKGNL